MDGEESPGGLDLTQNHRDFLDLTQNHRDFLKVLSIHEARSKRYKGDPSILLVVLSLLL